MSETWSSLLEAHQAVRDDRRHEAPAHEPDAAILACSDARVPPSVVFDQPAGSLFVVRVAGNTATPAAVASLDYAVDQLGVGLVVVLGHTKCGAIAAAASRNCSGHLQPITEPICELIDRGDPVAPEALTERNVVAAMTTLAATDSPVGRSIRAGAVELRGAVLDLDRDRLLPLETSLPTPFPRPVLETP